MRIFVVHSEQDDNPRSVTFDRLIAQRKRDEIIDIPYWGTITEYEVDFVSESIFAVIHGEYEWAYAESFHADYESARNSIPRGEDGYCITEWRNGECIREAYIKEE